MLAQRFPREDAPTRLTPVAPPPPSLLSDSASADQLAPGPVEVPRPRVTPLAPERYSVQFTLGQEAYEALRYAQALLGHQIPSGDVAAVFDRALRALVTELEKTKFAATSRPRAGRKSSSSDPRYIPSRVKRAVWERDGGQCGFVSESGARCPERSRLEFDHVLEVARGVEATVDGMHSREITDAPMEQRLHAALKFIGSRGRTYGLQQAVTRRSGFSQPPVSSTGTLR